MAGEGSPPRPAEVPRPASTPRRMMRAAGNFLKSTPRAAPKAPKRPSLSAKLGQESEASAPAEQAFPGEHNGHHAQHDSAFGHEPLEPAKADGDAEELRMSVLALFTAARRHVSLSDKQMEALAGIGDLQLRSAPARARAATLPPPAQLRGALSRAPRADCLETCDSNARTSRRWRFSPPPPPLPPILTGHASSLVPN